MLHPGIKNKVVNLSKISQCNLIKDNQTNVYFDDIQLQSQLQEIYQISKMLPQTNFQKNQGGLFLNIFLK
jgi:hypothetical protein